MQHKQRERAAYLVAEDKLTDEQIADELGIDRATLWRWKKRPAFKARVTEIVQEFADAIVAEGIANKQNRINALVDRHKRMEQVIQERATDHVHMRAPGGETGLLTVTYKGKDADREEFAVDTGLLSEMRATEKQAAQEAGQWSDRVEHSGPNGSAIEHAHRFDLTGFTDDELRDILSRATRPDENGAPTP